MGDTNPLVEYESDGSATELNYNVPMPTSYPCRSIVELGFPDSYFQSDDEEAEYEKLISAELEPLEAHVGRAMEAETFEPARFEQELVQSLSVETVETLDDSASADTDESEGDSEPVVNADSVAHLLDSPKAIDKIAERVEKRDSLRSDGGAEAKSSGQTPASPYLEPMYEMEPATVAKRMQNGEFPHVRTLLNGDRVPIFRPLPPEPQPQLALVERYEISNFLGDYGAGRTLKTFSLFPGEKTTISLRTYKESERKRKRASSIFEGSSKESSVEFERSLRQETKTSTKKKEKSSWNASGEAEFDIGIFSAGGGGGGGGSTNKVRKHTAKSVKNATTKHASKSSSERKIEVDTESSSTEKTERERTVEREIENINVSRTLNLVFRQMNQQYLTLFHLVDVRVAFSNGYPGSYREVPLYAIDDLLEEVVTEDERDEVKDRVLGELQHVYDYQDELHTDFVTEVERDEYSYWQVNDDKTTTYRDEATGLEKKVPGIVLSATTNTIRTDGVVVDSLLGQGEALDSYSRGLQTETVRQRDLKNDLLRTKVERNQLRAQLVENGDEAAAELFETVFEGGESKENDDGDESDGQTGKQKAKRQ